jgi:broad specificity phosphatase PhoE
MRRLILVRHAPTAVTRAAGFPVDEELDAPARAAAATLAATLREWDVPPGADVVVSPARRCRQTAAAAGLDRVHVEPAVAECDFGAWAGRTLADLHAEAPDATLRWMTEPAAAPHGGESLTDVLARVGGWLDAQAQAEGTAVAVTHGGVVKAAVVHALGAPPAAFWRVAVAPLSLTELHAHDGRWTVVRLAWTAGPPT